ncbi:threonine/serine dehydratase [Pyruvatibacter sp.]|uniref:threonine ammonia-lyase n=1 Tax=Pyruvatibacter sp. TaxID=1981328 RepID=UPI0032EE6CF7
MSAVPPSLIEDAAHRLEGHAVETPLLHSPALDALTGGRIFLKAENLQRIGAFKFRGAHTCLSRLTDDVRARGVVAWSSGNHAQGVAAAAQHFGVPATIVMPHDAPATKRDATLALGAQIVGYDRATQDRQAIARTIADETGRMSVPPYDHADVISGQGTVGLEVLAQLRTVGETPEQIIIPCGGGGLTAGIATAIKQSLPQADIFVAEPDGYDDTRRSLESGERVRLDGLGHTICDALLAPMPGELTFEINSRLVTQGFTVSDADVAKAMRFAFHRLKLVVEPGGAIALAALLNGALDSAGKTTVAILSGGNVDSALFADVLEEKI